MVCPDGKPGGRAWYGLSAYLDSFVMREADEEGGIWADDEACMAHMLP